MRKKIILLLIALSQVALLTFSVYRTSTKEIRWLNNNWGVLGMSYKVDVLDYHASVIMGEGYSYYVIDLNGFDFANNPIFNIEHNGDDNVQEIYENQIESLNIKEVTAEIDWSKDHKWRELENDKRARRLLCIIYDDNSKAVFVEEVGAMFPYDIYKSEPILIEEVPKTKQ